MKIKFIGTGSGKTSLKRHHSSLLITSKDYRLLVDCGDGISSALIKQNISFQNIDTIIISHLHADHFAGLPSLLTQMKLSERKNFLNIYVPESDLEFIELLIEKSYLFRERMKFELNLLPYQSATEISLSTDLKVIPQFNTHLEKYKPYLKYEMPSSASFYIYDSSTRIFYTGDIGSIKDLENISQHLDYLILEVSHITLEELKSVSQRFKAAKIILTHIDDELESDLISIVNSLKNEQKSNISIAFDGFEINQVP